MQVKCIKGHEGLLNEGDIYTVVAETSKGNYILSEVGVPEGFTSFSKDRFSILDEGDLIWTEDMEEAYWAEQPTTEYTALFFKIWGIIRIDYHVTDNITCRDMYLISLNSVQTITDEMSTMTFDDLMAFVGADYAIAALSASGGNCLGTESYKLSLCSWFETLNKPSGGNDHNGQPLLIKFGAGCPYSLDLSM